MKGWQTSSSSVAGIASGGEYPEARVMFSLFRNMTMVDFGLDYTRRPTADRIFFKEYGTERSIAAVQETRSWRTRKNPLEAGTWQNAKEIETIVNRFNGERRRERQPRIKHLVVVAQQWQARRARATFQRCFADTGIQVHVRKAYSPYYPKDENSQRRFKSFWRFAIWDTLAFIVSKLKGYC